MNLNEAQEFDRELDAYLRRMRKLDQERRTPFQVMQTRSDRDLADLQETIALLAEAMGVSRRAAATHRAAAMEATA